MKIRNGFVSNSSSSSFIIRTCCLTEAQKSLLFNIDEVISLLKPDDYEENDWISSQYANHIEFRTPTDNFNMERFVRDLGFRTDDVGYNT